jgi:hypothetical protein
MKTLFASTIAALAVAGAAFTGSALLSQPAHAQTVNVHKTPWCGCCAKWADHLEENGFDVVIHEHEDLTPVRTELGVPGELQSCHTGEVEGYAVEGHVPASDIRRLLAEMPSARGLSVPGMPAGSPGMEMGGRVDAYDVVLFGDEGQSTWQSYEGSHNH